MADKTPEEIAAEAAAGVTATVVDGANAANVDLTLADGAAAKPEAGPTAESLGVSAEQFAKFHSAEKGYNWEGHAKELQFKADQKPVAAAADPAKPADPLKIAEPAKDGEAQKVAEAAGLNWDDLGVKIMNDGDISPEDYAALAKVGIPDAVVKEHIELLTQSAESHVKDVLAAFGGEKSFEEVKAWAQKNYTEVELQSLENQLAQKGEYKVAVDTLMTKAGKGGMVNAGQTVPGTNTGGFETQNEMIAAMRDPRYKKDASYRQSVEAKVEASKWENNPRQHVG